MKRFVTIGILFGIWAVAPLASATTAAAGNLPCCSAPSGFDPYETPTAQRPLDSTQMRSQFGGSPSTAIPPMPQGQPGLAVTG
ncbi:hypothetical protein ACFXG4_41350 [Nocardia sp. NPDC059246]|uniref:hypothetical protein n=1 Tax=unclassified Nocardia TaxID=2637762 RepID=UPI003683190B